MSTLQSLQVIMIIEEASWKICCYEINISYPGGTKTWNETVKTGAGAQDKRSLTEYNKVLRKSKRDPWRKQCVEVEQTQVSARGETIRELLLVHFPRSVTINLTGAWKNSQL